MNIFYRYKNIHFSDIEAIRDIQETQLGKHISYCRKNSPFYRRMLDDADFDSKHFTMENLADLPFTERSFLELNEDEFCAVPSDKIIDIALSSGVTGNRPVMYIYSDYDLKRLAYNEKQSLSMCGVSTEDVVLLTCTIDQCFYAGLAHFLGIRDLGAKAIRSGNNNAQGIWEIIKKVPPTVIVGAPRYLKKLGDYMVEHGEDPGKTGVKKLICIGEPIRDKYLKLLKIGSDLQDIWGAEIFSSYSSLEIGTTFCECSFRQGGHIPPDLAIVEIIDEKGIALPPGVIGEVVVTPMAVKGMPLLRFKTGDISYVIDEPCLCERTSYRLGPILGRKEQMMNIHGTTLYPQKIYAALDEIKAISDYFIVATSKNNLSDAVTVFAAVNEKSCTSDIIKNRLKAQLQLTSEVVIGNEKAIREQIYTMNSATPVRFIDRR
ncbi:MAG: phenylacetate--CoA ligase family protein [bacterium]